MSVPSLVSFMTLLASRRADQVDALPFPIAYAEITVAADGRTSLLRHARALPLRRACPPPPARGDLRGLAPWTSRRRYFFFAGIVRKAKSQSGDETPKPPSWSAKWCVMWWRRRNLPQRVVGKKWCT